MMVSKFRACIKDTDELGCSDVPHKGHFVYGNLIKGNPNDDVDAIVGDLIEINDEYVNVEWWQSIEKGSAEQYTGLKDANGKEIYEGDIVKVFVVDDPTDCYQTTIKYWIEDGYPAFDIDAKYVPSTRWYDANILSTISESGSENIEVIGNVHENPELLEAQHG